MRILVLGAHGFLGRHIANGLSQNHTILRAGTSPDAGDEYMSIDPNTPNFIKVVEWAEPDICISCLGAASVPESFKRPMHDFTLNTVRTAQILEALRVASPRTRFVHLSSAAVYGNPLTSPVLESAPLQPVSPYGWHKRYAEEICREYKELHQISSISLRIFSAYGPGLRKQIFWDILQKAIRSKDVELFGTGEETRDFIYVEDIVSCVDVLIRKADFDGQAVNIANGTAVTIRSAATNLLSALGVGRNIKFSGAGRIGDPDFWQADISYLQKLGWVPRYTFNDGTAALAKWMLSEPSVISAIQTRAI